MYAMERPSADTPPNRSTPGLDQTRPLRVLGAEYSERALGELAISAPRAKARELLLGLDVPDVAGAGGRP